MNFSIASPFARLLTPLLLLGASTWAVFGSGRLPVTWQPLLIEVLPIAASVVALLLSLRFNRSRYTLLILLVAIAGLAQTQWRGQILPATESLLFALLVLNAFVFSLVSDRSLFSIHGLARVVILLLQGVAIYLLATYTGLLPVLLHNHEWFTLPAALAVLVQLPDAILLFAVIIVLVHMILSVVRNSSIQATFCGCQLGLLGIASGYPHPGFVPILVSCCGLMVTLAIIMDSHAMAYRDELTGLPARRALNQQLLSLGRRYTIAMLDIDHFKQFNDTHGHDIGDEVLRMVASQIARVGAGGKPFRYGGEEFAIVFPGKSAAQAQAELETLRASIEAYRMRLRGDRRHGGKQAARGRKSAPRRALSVTISIGYAERNARLKRPQTVIKAADRALYRAKHQGRNRVSG